MKIEEYFKKSLNRIVFIYVKEDLFQKKKELVFLKGVPIPVSLDQVSQDAREKQFFGSISPAASAEAMLYVIGADENFPYVDQYVRFLRLSVENPLFLALSSGIRQAEQKNYMEAAILFRAAEKMDLRIKKQEQKENPIKIIEIKQTVPDALYNYAKACRDIFMDSEETAMKIDFREEAVKGFERLSEEFPDFAPSYYYLGYFYMNRKMYQEASSAWEGFLRLNEDPVMEEEVKERLLQLEDMLLYEKGYLAILNERCEEGLNILLPLYDKHKHWWNLLFFIGLAYRKIQDPQAAIPFFRQVLEIKPSQGDAMNELGLCYTAVSEYENAEKYLKKAALITENDPEILCNLAAMYLSWDKISEAETYLIRAEELVPDEEIVKLWRMELERRKRH